jgi:uncharacterized surface protein with fasciclin (FAS1) repeats
MSDCLTIYVNLLNNMPLVMFKCHNYSLNNIDMKTKAKQLELMTPVQMMRMTFIAVLMVFFVNTAMGQKTVVDIVVGSENHTTLEAAVIAAELADDLQGAGPFTLFAPTDAAFEALPEGTVAELLKDPTGDLANILLYHAVSGKAYSKDLSDGQMIETLQGEKIKVKFKDGKAYINDAMVTVADIKADNGVVHVIDAVILPAPKMASKAAAASGGCN